VKQDDIDKKINEIKASYPHMAAESKKNDVTDVSENINEMLSKLSSCDEFWQQSAWFHIGRRYRKIQRRGSTLFYQLYAKYLQDEADFHNLEGRSIQLSIGLDK